MKALKTTNKRAVKIIVTLRSLTHPIAGKKQKFNPRKSLMYFAGAKDTVVNINRINTNADGTIKVGGYTASLTTNAANLNIGKGGINLSNQAGRRSLLVENLTGNITIDGALMVNNQVGGYALAGSSANFEFKAGVDTKNGTATFNNDIHLGKTVNLRVDAHTAYFNGNIYLGKSTNLRVNSIVLILKILMPQRAITG